jgi:hypothetical protein
MSMLVWVVTLRGVVGRYQRFGVAYCLQLQQFSPEDGDSMLLRNVGVDLEIHTALQPEDQNRHSEDQYSSSKYLYTAK